MTTETNNELPKVEYEYEEWRRAVLRASARQALETLRREFAEADHDSAQQQPSEEGESEPEVHSYDPTDQRESVTIR